MTILIENLTFDTIIGILESERITVQKVVIDCVIDYDYLPGTFINYADVSNHIIQSVQKKQFFLIEEALESLSHSLKEEFTPIHKLSLTLRKPDILANCTVGVQENFIF
ncbi:MAG TPA: dihydroneopterin aldolase [Sulfuricurvum sp.]|nr:dihydroneopterin aldolase [Sulfuricurvum sp.]